MFKFTKQQEYALYGVVVGLIVFAVIENQKIQADHAVYFPKALSTDEINQYGNTDNKAVVIYPIFTQFAYKPDGFYPPKGSNFYPYHTTVSMKPFGMNASYVTGFNSLQVLQQLHYQVITDIDVDQHPEILNDYNKVILLHNEYMTKKEFDAIMSHKNVIYLYPNSAYAQVSIDYNDWAMTLVQGHHYKGMDNGFNFMTSSNNEYNLNCNNWKWQKMPNGMELTCWPEFLIMEDRSILQELKDYPNIVPPLVESSNNAVLNPSSLPKCNAWGFCGNNGYINDTK